MKSNRDWCQLYEDSDMFLADLLDRVKADALRHAAETARDINDGHDWPVSRVLDAEANRLIKDP